MFDGIKTIWGALTGAPAAKGILGPSNFPDFRHGGATGLFRNPADPRSTPWINSAWYSVAQWVCSNFPEAEVVVERRVAGKWEEVPGHSLALLLARPNKYMGGYGLWSGTILSDMAAGNGYWVKSRDVNGAIEGLWFCPWTHVAVNAGKADEEWIKSYTVSTNAFDRVIGLPDLRRDFDPRDIVHFRNMVDPGNPRLGLSPMVANGYELQTDSEAALATLTMMRNLGVTVPMFAPPPGAKIDQPAAEAFKTMYAMATTGLNRGKAVVASEPLAYMNVGGTPKDMEFSANRKDASARVCATYNVDPMVPGLPSDSKTFANYNEARRAAIESNIVPSYRRFGEDVAVQLLPDFELYPQDFRVRFKSEGLQALQEDRSKARQDAAKMYAVGMIDRYEAQTVAGMTPEDKDKDVYASPGGAPADDPATDPSADPNKTIEDAAKALLELRTRLRRAE